jgi:DNA invertase Pin-like site-specific DNA recombinase
MLEHIASNGVRTIIVETANRFARDLIVQETGHRMLKGKGIEIIAADSPGAFMDDTPTATFVRQVLGAVAQLDKAMTVAKLRGAFLQGRIEQGFGLVIAATTLARSRGVVALRPRASGW